MGIPVITRGVSSYTGEGCHLGGIIDTVQGGCSDTEQHTFCAHFRHVLVLAPGAKKQLR